MKQPILTSQPFLINEIKGLNPSQVRTRLEESIKKNGGSLLVTGVLQRAEAKNQNKRIYPRNILEREVKNYEKVFIAENRAYGELDHPDSSVVNFRNVSHVIRKIWWEGNDVVGTVEILNTPSGNILKELILAGLTVGISSRGMGSVTQVDEETVAVSEDYNLVCWDFVSNPSTHQAFLAPISESVNKNELTQEQYAEIIIRDIICELAGNCCLK